MEKFEQKVFITINEGVEKLNEYVEKGLIINNLNIVPINNSGYIFVYSVRQKFEKKENNRDKNNETPNNINRRNNVFWRGNKSNSSRNIRNVYNIGKSRIITINSYKRCDRV